MSLLAGKLWLHIPHLFVVQARSIIRLSQKHSSIFDQLYFFDGIQFWRLDLFTIFTIEITTGEFRISWTELQFPTDGDHPPPVSADNPKGSRTTLPVQAPGLLLHGQPTKNTACSYCE